MLVEEGFLYDSSIFPVWNHRYGIPRAARQPGFITTPAGARIFEIPLSTLRLPGNGFPLGVNVPVSGGAYFRLYPYRLTQALVKRLERAGERLVFYAHPWEYDPEHPRIRLPRFVPHVTHYMNLDTMAARTRQLLGRLPLRPGPRGVRRGDCRGPRLTAGAPACASTCSRRRTRSTSRGSSTSSSRPDPT